MRVRSIITGLALVLLLGACERPVEPSEVAAVAAEPTTPATPTLLPGLPTSTPWSAVEAGSPGGVDPQASATPPAPPTSTVSPTATPQPAERVELGQSYLENEDFEAAADQFQAGLQSDQLSEEERQEALLALGRAQLGAGQSVAANEAFGVLLAGAANSESPAGAATVNPPEEENAEVADAYYYLAQSYQEQGDCQAAIGAYSAYLASNDTLASYIRPLIGECYLVLGEREEAIRAFELAAEAETPVTNAILAHYRLAQLYQEEGDYKAALAQYEAVLALAENEATLGQAAYLAGTAELMAGELDAGYGRYLDGMERYPRAYESYLALVALIEAGYEVDDYQRGLVDYYAKAYEPAVSAFGRYLEAPGAHNEDAHLYLAWSLEGLGDIPAALDQLQAYIDVHTPPEEAAATRPAVTPAVGSERESPAGTLAEKAAARGNYEKAKMLARAGRLADAAESYAFYVETYPDGEHGPLAAWWSAAYAEQLNDPALAIERYQLLAGLYPEHEDADEALFRAGYLANEAGDEDEALTSWEAAVERYPNDSYGAAALVWLMRTAPDDEQEKWLELAAETRGSTYYPLRAQHIATDTAPFEAPKSIALELGEGDRRAAESWLGEQLDLTSTDDLAALPDALANDGRLVRGAELWRLGLRQEAKLELENLRNEVASDPLSSYQLAVFLSELGLYRSSILAAVSVMNELEVDAFDAPPFIAGLAYPTHYSDLIAAEAESYGYDPLLQFSLVRQESLFESFATSGAAAQGLSQVIPDTGAYIAQRLGWEDFVNSDLYKPHVGIAFGAFYLDQQIDAFDGDIAAALSAYNAGPGNAARWYEVAGGDIDLYVDTVDFYETQQYIERIYAGHAIYRHLYGQE